MKEKQCFKCHRMLPLSDFYAHKMMGDGHLGKCKECTKSDVARHREENLAKVRAYDRERASLPHRRELHKEISKRPHNAEKKLEWARKRRNMGDSYMKAHNKLIRSVYSGLIKRPKRCEKCLKKCRPHGHHDDYAKPLEVLWLCPKCHHARHVELGWGFIARKPL